MSTFYEHHKASIRFQYSCFDRILLHAALPLLIRPDRAHGFFTHHRNIYPVTKHVLHDISERYHQWVANQAERWSVEILNDPHVSLFSVSRTCMSEPASLGGRATAEKRCEVSAIGECLQQLWRPGGTAGGGRLILGRARHRQGVEMARLPDTCFHGRRAQRA